MVPQTNRVTVQIAIVLLVTVGSFLSGAGSCTGQEAVPERMAQIRQMLSVGDFKQAASTATQLVREIPSLELPVSDQIEILRLASKAEYQVGYFQQSRQYAEQALAQLRTTAHPDGQAIATIEGDLAVSLRHLGRYRESEDKFSAAYDAFQIIPDRDNQIYSNLLVDFGILQYQLGDLDRAAQLTGRAVELRRGLEPPAPVSLAQALDNFGTVLMEQGRLSTAEPPLQEALRIRRELLKPGHPDIAASLNNLGTLLQKRGEYAKAEALFRESIDIDIATFGEGNGEVLLDLNNLAETLHSMGRPDEALELQWKVLSGRERQSAKNGADEDASYDLALSNANVANLLSDLGRDSEAEKYYLKALSLDEKRANGRPSVEIAADLNSLGDFMREGGKPNDAEVFFAKGIEISEHLGDSGLAMKALLLNNRGVLDLDQGKFEKASISFEEALNIRTKILPSDHKDLAVSYAWFAEDLSRLSDPNALDHARKALAIVLSRGSRLAGIGVPVSAVAAEARTSRAVVEKILSVIARNGSRDDAYLPPDVADDALAALQIAQSSGTAVIAARAATALLSSKASTAPLLRELSDLNDKREAAARWEATRAAGATPGRTLAGGTSKEIQAQIEMRLGALGPDISELVRPPKLTFSAIQQNLEVSQGWLGVVVGSQNTSVVLVTSRGVQISLVGQGSTGITKRVQHLVEQLDPSARMPFDLKASHDLYDTLFGSFSDTLKGLGSLVVCADGPLESLPLAVLVTSDSGQRANDEAESYRRADWLSNRSIIQLTPSFSALLTSRLGQQVAGPSQSFIGFGNPSLGPAEDTGNLATASELGHLYNLQGTTKAVAKVLELPSLPETAIQLTAMDTLFGGASGQLVMGSDATRDAVLTRNLSGFRFLAFATHGLLATKNATGEPALVMTPVPGHDDGLLTATDIAKLNLNADLVILSACNTAAPRIGYAADGLSGLARAFFQAGARTIVISHWPVDKNATTALMKILSSSRGESIALAFNHAARSLRDDQDFSHPAFWAPFSLVGGGKEILVKS
jgi:CHAT domain-containing protein/Tfp pilus assembly protein PilF